MIQRLVPILIFIAFFIESAEYVPSYHQAIGAISRDLAADLYNREGLVLIGSGGGLVKGHKTFIYHFEGCRALDLVSARALALRCVDDLVVKLNRDMRIRNCVPGYPFSSSNVDMMIGLIDGSGQFQRDGKIAFILAVQNQLRYSVYDENSGHLTKVHSELIEDARKLTDSVEQ